MLIYVQIFDQKTNSKENNNKIKENKINKKNCIYNRKIWDNYFKLRFTEFDVDSFSFAKP